MAEENEKIVPLHTNELERLTQSLDKLFNDRRRQMVDTVARHAEERTRLANDYVRQMEDLKYKAAEALHTMEKRHAEELDPLTELVGKLEGMRR